MTDTTENSGTTENTETPENEAPEAAAPEIDLAEALLAKDQEIADLKDRVLRTMADMENTRRRLERDKAEATQYAVTGFARDMLAVAENLRRAVASLPADGFDNVRAGIEATERIDVGRQTEVGEGAPTRSGLGHQSAGRARVAPPRARRVLQ